MKLNERIANAIKDHNSYEFLNENKALIRENLLIAQKRITRFTILILILIAICELLISKSITSLSVMGTEINVSKTSLLLFILPPTIAYFWLTLNRQLILSISLKRLFTEIIQVRNPEIVELDIDEFLLTHMDDSIDDILTRGKINRFKKLLIISSIIISVIFSFTPIFYCIYLYRELFSQEIENQKTLILSCSFTIFFFTRVLLLNINAFIELGIFKSIEKNQILTSTNDE